MTSTATDRPLRVAIGEDDVLLREGIARILADAGLEVVALCGDADDLLHRSLAYRPDVVVTDVQMPPRREDDGLRAALELRRREPGIGVLILSQFCEPAYVLDLVGQRPGGGRLPAQGTGRRPGGVRRRGDPGRGRRQRPGPRGGRAGCSAGARRTTRCAC